MRRPELSQTKRQGGLSLVPALWDEIDRIAKLGGVPRNRVIETALMEKFLPSGIPHELSKTEEKSRDKELERLPA
jgi:hypothetical protein